MSTRRGFLGGLAGILAAGFAPAAVGSGVLMPAQLVVTVDWLRNYDFCVGDTAILCIYSGGLEPPRLLSTMELPPYWNRRQ